MNIVFISILLIFIMITGSITYGCYKSYMDNQGAYGAPMWFFMSVTTLAIILLALMLFL